jgi:hypothetical protein
VIWEKVAPNAVKMAMDMVADCPELKDKLQELPHNRPWEVTPLIGSVCSHRNSFPSHLTFFFLPKVVDVFHFFFTQCN